MSEPTEETSTHAGAETGTAVPPTPPPSAPPARRSSASDVVRDALLVLVWFVVAGIVGAIAWWRLVDLPQATRVGGSVVINADQLGKQVNIDGWFFVIALVGGLVSGIVLLFIRERDPLLMVVLVTLGGGLASFLMDKIGRWLGPGSAEAALRHRANGAHVSMPLQVHAPGVLWVWPAAAALGALVFLWVLRAPDPDQQS